MGGVEGVVAGWRTGGVLVSLGVVEGLEGVRFVELHVIGCMGGFNTLGEKAYLVLLLFTFVGFG